MKLAWGAVGERFYEAGVDRGVLYVDTLPGVPWNGLLSVAEAPQGAEAKPYYLDGIKYLNRTSPEEFTATIEAYTYPQIFSECDGSALVGNGLYASQQTRKPFSLSYRTRVGNDITGVEFAYKIHLIYGATAAPSGVTNSTIGDSLEPFNFSWTLTTRPPSIVGRRPTSHFVIDSRETHPELLKQIEDILYGTLTTDARIPPIGELVYIFTAFNSSSFDAGLVGQTYYNTFDSGTPSTVHTSTINGGTA